MHEIVSEPAMATHDSLVKQFLNYLRSERHFSAHTARCYAADLDQFRGYLLSGQLPLTGPRAGSGGANGHSHKPASAADDAPKLPTGVNSRPLLGRILESPRKHVTKVEGSRDCVLRSLFWVGRSHSLSVGIRRPASFSFSVR
jgi:hypothetical protein